MSLLLPFTINTLWSFKRELFFILLTFLMVLLLPVVAVIVLTHSGHEEASDALVQLDVKTNVIKLYYPDGTLYKEISINVTRPATGVITNEFGARLLPFYLSHSGIDIAGKKGDPITPFMPGKVIYAGEIFWGFGKHVIVDHGDNITSIYAHLDKINVKKDQEVKPGDVIGLEGSTGWSTGDHLHFQVNVFGIPVNPRIFL
jgi:murein DD-endopeptidase MepM/ murein hydrolase activator NlpD